MQSITQKTMASRIHAITEGLNAKRAMPPSVEHRWANRRVTSIPGRIMSQQLQEPVACVIRNTSATGALIDLGPSGHSASLLVNRGLSEFSLIFASTTAPTSVPCSVVWFSETIIGVRYSGPFKTEEVMRKRRAIPA